MNKSKKIIQLILGKKLTDYFKYNNLNRYLKSVQKLNDSQFESFLKKNYPEVQIIKQKLLTPKVCLDIGAHYGIWSFLLSKIFKKTNIYSFEPTKRSFNILQKMKKRFKLNFKPINKGLGNKETVAFIDTIGDSAMNHISCQGEKIFIDTLDNFSTQNKLNKVDFIKIDVEGYELNVIKGGEIIIKKCMPVIYCEIIDIFSKRYGKTANSTVNLLLKIGYSCFGFNEKIRKFEKVKGANKKYSNYLFIEKHTN